MEKKGLMRNRGISIAAAAVSAALVAPMVQPVATNSIPAAFAQENDPAPAPGGDITEPPAGGDDGSDAETTPGNAPADLPTELQGQKVIWADAVENGYVKRVSNLQTYRNLLSGRAWEITERGQVSGTDLPQVPAGTVVYMQWRDTDGSVSPYYAAHVGTGEGFRGPDAQGGPGLYAFDLREPWVDANGKEHLWEAKKGQEYRLWIPAYERDGVRYNMIRQANPLLPGGFTDGGANGATRFLNHNVQFTRILMAQAPKIDLMTRPREEWKDGTIRGADGNPAVIAGDEDENAGGPDVRAGLLPGREYRNTVSGTVWKETGNGRDKRNAFIGPSYQKRHDFGVEGATVIFSKMTKEGYAKYNAEVNSLPETARTEAAEKFLAQNPDVIDYTYFAKTNADGQFTIQLPEGAIDSYVSGLDDIWMGVLDEEGNAVTSYSPWMVPQFHNPGVFTSMRPRDPGANMNDTPVINIPTVVGDKLTSIAFALLPFYDAHINITNFDTADRPAKPGDVAELELNGTLLPLPNWIEWRDANGNVVKGGPDQCMIADNSLEGNPCATFEVPANAAPGTVYTAVLVNGDPEDKDEQNVFSADSFVVEGALNAEHQPEYKDTDAPRGEETTIDPPVDEENPVPNGTEFSEPTDPNNKIVGPEGPLDEFPGELTINPDGSITLTPKDDAPLGNYEVPVLVTYPDGSKETITASIEVIPGKPKTADTTDPNWEDTTAKPGEPKKVPNTGDEIPAGSTVEVDGELPEGWTATVNPEDHSITVTPPENATPGDEATIPVKVTYPDGSVDNEELKVTVTAGYEVAYDEAKGQPDSKIKAQPKSIGEDTPPETTTYAPGDKKETHDGLWDISDPDANTGEVTAEVTWDKLKQRYQDERKNTLGGDECVPGESFSDDDVKAIIDKLKPLFSAQATVDVTFTEAIKQDEVPVNFTLVDKNGAPLAESTDWDGDGVDNETEIKDCKNPLDPNDQTGNTPDWDDATTKPNTPVDIPNTGGPVEGEHTLEFEGPGTAELKPDGTITVTPNEGAKPGDKIVVTVKDPKGNEVDKITVTIGENPKWDDKTTEPKKPVDVPNTGGPIEGEHTLEVEGPGTAELKPDGTITVTPNDNAKDGDKIVVTVKDPKGNVVDTVTVTIKETGPGLSSQIDGQKCTNALLGWGLPLLLMIPIGIATQVSIPGLEGLKAQLDQQIRNANTELQRQLGIHNPEMAKAAADLDARLKTAGANLSQALAGLAVLAYGLGALIHLSVVCLPKGEVLPENRQSSPKNLPEHLKPGSSIREGSSNDGSGNRGSSNEGSGANANPNGGAPASDAAPAPAPAPAADGNNDAAPSAPEAPAANENPTE